MADDTDTDPNALADRLDFMAQHPVGGYRNWNADLRAAADGLRQYAAITAALGDPDELRYHARGDVADTGGGDDLQARLRAIADAAASLSPTPTPQHCPTCGSTAKAARMFQCFAGVPDAWHDNGQP